MLHILHSLSHKWPDCGCQSSKPWVTGDDCRERQRWPVVPVGRERDLGRQHRESSKFDPAARAGTPSSLLTLNPCSGSSSAHISIMELDEAWELSFSAIIDCTTIIRNA